MVCLRTLIPVANILFALSSGRSPIVIVPGLGGSVLKAWLHDRPRTRDCATESDVYTLFVQEKQLTRYQCFVENFALHPDPLADDSVVNSSGVHVFPQPGLDGIEYSNYGSGDLLPMPYMLELTKSLMAHGYSRDMSLRAATYDFRVAGAPRQTQQQFAHLKAFIEKASRDNSAKPVHLLSHSLGGPVTNQFLILQSPVWKKQYIASHIMLSAPLLGTPVALQSLISGPMYDFVPQVLPSLLTPVLRTLPSMLWMFPREPANSDRIVWSSLPPFIQTPNANISTDNTEKLLSMLDATMLSKLQPFVNTIVANSMDDPGVKVLCMFANDTATNMNVQYSSDHFKGGKVVDKGLGDGTVPLQSLRWCSEWADTTMREFEFGGALSSHTDIVKKSEIISAVISWVTQRVDELPLLV
mmetsp:Transcript_99256/g.155194  ORF Transcript_99256/g.155194 Transcript_99256/m.155194 type:complete len:413 (+) Transcript_99256:33-1271(+)